MELSLNLNIEFNEFMAFMIGDAVLVYYSGEIFKALKNQRENPWKLNFFVEEGKRKGLAVGGGSGAFQNPSDFFPTKKLKFKISPRIIDKYRRCTIPTYFWIFKI